MNRVKLSCPKIQFKDFLTFNEYDRIGILATRWVLEMILHTHFVEKWNVFDNNSVDLLVLIILKITL